jgi:predicted MFS family arabinose efflux permease
VTDVDAGVDRAPRLVPLSLARLVSNGLFRFVYPFLALVAVDVGLGEGAETLLITGLAVGGMVVPWVSRWLVGDRDAPVRSTSTGLALLFVGTVLLGVLAPGLTNTTALLGTATALVATILLGLAKPLLDVGSMTYVSARVDWAGRGRAISIMELTWGGGLLLLGPLGLLAAVVGWQGTLVGLGLAALASIPLLRHWLDPDDVTARLTTGARRPGGPDDEAALPPRHALRRSGILFLAAFTVAFIALETTFGVVGLWLEDGRGVDPDLVATVVAIGSVGEIGGSLATVLVADRLGKARTAMGGALLCAAGFLLLGNAAPLWLAIVGLVVGLFGTETLIVAGIALASEVDPTRRAAFLARIVAWSSIARAVASSGAALLLREAGIRANAGLSAVAAVVSLVALVALVRHDPRLRG